MPRIYSVFSTTNLLAPAWVTNAAGIPSDGTPCNSAAGPSNTPSLFFRLGLEKP